MRAVVGRIVHDGVVGDTQFVQQIKKLTDMHVMFDHAGLILIHVPTDDFVRLGAHLILHVGPEMHPRAVPPDEPLHAFFVLALDEVDGGGNCFVIHGFHALFGQRAGVFDWPVGAGFDHPTRAERLAEFRVLRVIFVLGLFFGVQVIQIAKKLIKPVVCRQHLIPVAQVVFTKLTSGIALGLQQAGNGRVFDLHAFFGAGHANLGQTCPEHRLTRDEG